MSLWVFAPILVANPAVTRKGIQFVSGGSRYPVTDGCVDFGRDGSVRYVGAFPGRDLRCAEEHGKWVFPRVGVPCARKTVIPRTNINFVYWTIIV